MKAASRSDWRARAPARAANNACLVAPVARRRSLPARRPADRGRDLLPERRPLVGPGAQPPLLRARRLRRLAGDVRRSVPEYSRRARRRLHPRLPRDPAAAAGRARPHRRRRRRPRASSSSSSRRCVAGAKGEARCLLSVVDRTVEVQAENNLRAEMLRDSLTGLPNRLAFTEIVEKAGESTAPATSSMRCWSSTCCASAGSTRAWAALPATNC